MKIFLEIAFITGQPTELAGFPTLFNRIERGVVKETVDVPMRIAQPVNWSGIPVKEFRIQELARSTIFGQSCLSDFALHLGFHRAHRFIHCRPCDMLYYLTARDRQINAERLRNSEHESIANLPVADRLPVFLPAHILTGR